MDLVKKFGTDPESVNDGVWVTLDRGSFEEDKPASRVKIARAGNKAYRAFIARHVTDQDLDKIDSDRLVCEAMGKYIIKDWEGIELDGEPIAYSEQKAFELMMDPRLTDFREWISGESLKMQNFRIKQQEQDLEK